ncbi:site-specific integrase, partial [Aggregatibacter sp.]
MNDLTLLDLFLNELWIGKGLSPNTVQSYRLDLTALCDWLGERKLSLLGLDSVDLQTFLGERVEQGYKATSTARLLSAIRKLFQYLYQEKYRTDDPSAVLSSPKLPSRLPKYLTEQQVTDLLNVQRLDQPIELRDKAMLELLYAT